MPDFVVSAWRPFCVLLPHLSNCKGSVFWWLYNYVATHLTSLSHYLVRNNNILYCTTKYKFLQLEHELTCVCICAFMCACVSHGICMHVHRIYVYVCMVCSEIKKAMHIYTLILWFILDRNVLSLHVEDSSMFSGVDIGAM